MSLRTRQAVLQAGVTLLARKPTASMSEVAEAAGVGRATVFRLFDSREGLLKALAHEAIREIDRVAEEAAGVATSATDALRLVLQSAVETAEHVQFLWTAAEVWQDPEVVSAYERQSQELTDLLVAARDEGAFRADVPASWLTSVSDGLMWAAARSVSEGALGRKQATDLLWQTLMTGLGPRERT